MKLPKILGEDVAGVVAEAPEGSSFKPGDRVFAGTAQMLSGDSWGEGRGAGRGRSGREAGLTLSLSVLPHPLWCAPGPPHPPHAPRCMLLGVDAEWVAVDEANAVLIPEGISFQDAAAIPVAGLTAWQALALAMPLAGKRVLVHGGAGGVGHLAVQVRVCAAAAAVVAAARVHWRVAGGFRARTSNPLEGSNPLPFPPASSLRRLPRPKART